MLVVANSNHFKWSKAIKKVNKQAHQKNFFISRNVGMTHWWKKYGDKGRDVQERLHVQLSTSHQTHIHILHVVFWDGLASVVVIGFQMQSDWLTYSEYTTCRDVYVVDSWTWSRSWTCSISTLVTILFSPVSHPYMYISWNLRKIFWCACLIDI